MPHLLGSHLVDWAHLLRASLAPTHAGLAASFLHHLQGSHLADWAHLLRASFAPAHAGLAATCLHHLRGSAPTLVLKEGSTGMRLSCTIPLLCSPWVRDMVTSGIPETRKKFAAAW